MSDPVLNALKRNRAIAEAAGQTARVERIDARLAALAEPKRSSKAKKKKEEKPAEEPIVDTWRAPEPGLEL